MDNVKVEGFILWVANSEWTNATEVANYLKTLKIEVTNNGVVAEFPIVYAVREAEYKGEGLCMQISTEPLASEEIAEGPSLIRFGDKKFTVEFV